MTAATLPTDAGADIAPDTDRGGQKDAERSMRVNPNETPKLDVFWLFFVAVVLRWRKMA